MVNSGMEVCWLVIHERMYEAQHESVTNVRLEIKTVATDNGGYLRVFEWDNGRAQ